MTEESDSLPKWNKGIARRIPTKCKLLDLGLLVLRCGLGLCFVIVHSWSKLGHAVAFSRGQNWELVQLVRSLGFPGLVSSLSAPRSPYRLERSWRHAASVRGPRRQRLPSKGWFRPLQT
jgi:hypothetical protein